MPELSRSRRKKQRIRSRVFVGGAVLIAVVALFFAAQKTNLLLSHMAMEKAVVNGEVQISAVKSEWNTDEDFLIATVYIANSSDLGVRGRLEFEFTLSPRRISRAYLDALFKGVSVEEKELTAHDLRTTRDRGPQKDAVLAYLENGEKTTYPDYEEAPGGATTDMPQLVFRKHSYPLFVGSGELTRAVVRQGLPSDRMGSHLEIDDVKLVGISFD